MIVLENTDVKQGISVSYGCAALGILYFHFYFFTFFFLFLSFFLSSFFWPGLPLTSASISAICRQLAGTRRGRRGVPTCFEKEVPGGGHGCSTGG